MLSLRRRALSLVALLALSCPSAMLSPSVVQAEESKAGVVTTLQGRATAARTALPQPVALKYRDDVFLNDRIVTGDRSIVRLLLGGKALVTVRERSTLTVTEVPGRSTIDLTSGKIALAVTRDKMQPGETVEVRTPNAIAAVRGTTFVTEVTRGAGVTSVFYGFTGQVLVSTATQTLTLRPDTVVRVTDGAPATLDAMTTEAREQALVGLRPDVPPVGAGQASAKASTLGATVTTLGSALSDVATPLVVNPPTPPARVIPPLLPGGRTIDAVRPAGGCPLPVCID